MRLTPIFLFSILSLFIICITRSTAYKTVAQIENSKNVDHGGYLTRQKREMEELYNEEYPETSQETQEEPGFWDRVVKVALKLFNRFIEWLNSS